MESGKPTPVSKKLALGYIWLKNSIKGMLPPHPTNSGSFPPNTFLLALKKASLSLGSKSPESKPLLQNYGSTLISAWYSLLYLSFISYKISLALLALSVGGNLREHLRPTLDLIEFEASLRLEGTPSTAVTVS